MNVKKMLLEYKDKECKINMLKNQLNYLKQILNSKDIETLYYKEEKNISNSIIKRPTENKAINSEQIKKLTYEQIKEDIKTIKSRLIVLEAEKNNIDIIIDSLDRHEQYIIKCRFFHKMTYDCIIKNMQSNQFKNDKLWSMSTVFKLNKSAIEKIDSFLTENSYMYSYI